MLSSRNKHIELEGEMDHEEAAPTDSQSFWTDPKSLIVKNDFKADL